MNVRRRDLVRGLAVGGGIVLAGCGGGGDDLNTPTDGGGTATPTEEPDPVPNLEVANFAPRVDESAGTVAVTVTVENVGDEPASGTLVVRVTAGDQTASAEQSVSVDAGQTAEYTVEVETDVEAFRNEGAIDFSWRSN